MKIIGLYLAALLLAIAPAQGETPVFTYDGSNHEITGRYITILEDSSCTLSIEQVSDQEGFKNTDQNVPNLMISKSVFWAKIQIENKSDEEHLLMEYAYPIVDKANLYIISPDGSVTMQELGEHVPISKRRYKHPSFIYELPIPMHESRTVFLEIANTQQIMVPLKIGSKEIIYNTLSNKDIFSSIYSGIILVMFLYNLFIFFATRDKSYLYYTAYIILAGITHISHHGYTYKLLWPSSPVLAQWSVALSPALVGIAGVFLVRNFMQTKIYSMKFHRFYDLLLIFYAGCIALFFVGMDQLSYQLSQATALVLSITIIATSATVAHRGYHPAKYFFTAFTIFMISIFIFILKDFGILPYNELTVYCLEIGSSLELILLSFALADKINIMKKEKEISQARTLEALKENERIVREQNIILEGKVKERTKELEHSNNDLSNALTDLKDTQSQLVDAEKMASLGQLTAGIAHEINNPINFVVSNINPLKRDVQDILEILEKYAEIKDETDLQNKLNEIKDLKEDLDLNYLIEEIELLLNGIDDGANRTAEIVNSLRTFSRLDESALKKADINDGLDSTLILLNNCISEDLEIIRKYDNLPPVDCYAGKLNQLFMNILKNATQAFDGKIYEAQAHPTITIITKDLGENIMVKISDNGKGMDEATRNKIFEPFFTTKDVGEGTGLGLSIAYNIIDKHHGTINVESEPGVGTGFTITIPKQQPASEDDNSSMKAERRKRLTHPITINDTSYEFN